MLDLQPTSPDPSCPVPFRWSRSEILHALDDFAQSEPTSRRQFAQQIDVPHATLDYWLRHFSASPDDPIDSFFRSSPGDFVLRRIVLSALLTFVLRGGCGIRLVSDFLQLAHLDPFVACSRGALFALLVRLESDLAAFAQQHQPPLAQQMPFKTISVATDEHFHEDNTCLVAIEPVSNFILVECYRDHRDADTWTEVLQKSIQGMHVEIVLLCSDMASGLLCTADKCLEVMHSPDLFHGQRDLLKAVLPNLIRPIQQARKELEKVEKVLALVDRPLDQPLTKKDLERIAEAAGKKKGIEEQLEQATATKEAAVQAVRAIGDDYHPFDRETGKARTAEEVEKRLKGHVEELRTVVTEERMSEQGKQRLDKAQKWVTMLMGMVAWYWSVVGDRLDEMELEREQEEVIRERLISGYYWEAAARRARNGEERKRLEEMASKLLEEGWADEAMSRLDEEKRKEVQKMAKGAGDLFQRSSSCVEGRNGRLALMHHGHSRVSERRLKAMTVIHNYVVKREDGTTAAQRYFGQKHEDVCSWLLERMPGLPRPAKKRPKATS